MPFQLINVPVAPLHLTWKVEILAVLTIIERYIIVY